jgi:hypothetical protein
MHALPLPFGLALVLVRRHEPRSAHDDHRPIHAVRRPSHRECVLGDLTALVCRRPAA